MAQKLDINNPIMDAMKAAEEPTGKKKTGRPKVEGRIRAEDGGPSIQVGLPPELRRFSAICKYDNWRWLHNYAFTTRISFREALDEVIEDFRRKYERDKSNPDIIDRDEFTRARRSKK